MQRRHGWNKRLHLAPNDPNLVEKKGQWHAGMLIDTFSGCSSERLEMVHERWSCCSADGREEYNPAFSLSTSNYSSDLQSKFVVEDSASQVPVPFLSLIAQHFRSLPPKPSYLSKWLTTTDRP